MADYRPAYPFNVPVYLLTPTYTMDLGVKVKHYPDPGECTEEGKKKSLCFCSFRTFGGTETNSNGLLSVEDTAKIETWYRPDIKADCAIQTEDGKRYEIIGTPENINMRNQFLVFKVRKIAGGA